MLDPGLRLLPEVLAIRAGIYRALQKWEAARLTHWNVQSDGTRHRAVYRLCSVEPKVIGFVISQDSQVRMIANVDESVIFWMPSIV